MSYECWTKYHIVTHMTLSPRKNPCFYLVNTGHVTRILASDLSIMSSEWGDPHWS